MFCTLRPYFVLLIASRIHNDHVRLLSARNSGHSTAYTTHVQDTRLLAENAKLKERIKALQSRISTIRSNVASNIIKLDIAWAGWRIFSCSHSDLNRISDGKKSLRNVGVTKDSVLKDMMQEWKNDSQFFEKYHDVRKEIF